MKATARVQPGPLALAAVCAVVGLLVVRSPSLAIVAVAVGIGSLLPAWSLLVASLVTARGFDILLPRTGAGGWQSASALLALLAIAKWSIARRGSGQRWVNHISVLIGLLIGWLIVASAAAGTSFTAPLRLIPFALVPIAYYCEEPGEDRMLRGVIWFAIAEVVLSLGQVTKRLEGVHIQDPHQMGFLLVAALALVTSHTVTMRYPRLVVAFLLLAILATRTRGVWLAAIVLLALLLLPGATGSRALAIALGSVAIGALLFTPLTRAFDLNPHSADVRTESVSAGLQEAKTHPVVGVGWSSIPVVPGVEHAPGDRPYDLFVFLAVVGGFPAAVLALLLTVSGARLAARRHFGALLFFGAFIAFSVSEATLYPGSLTAPLFFLFLALAVAGAPNTRRLIRARE